MKIYKVVDNKPTLICQHACNSGSCKGEESECFSRLHVYTIENLERDIIEYAKAIKDAKEERDTFLKQF